MLKFNIDGVDYPVDRLSETAQAQLRSLQFTEAQLQKLRNEVAVFETARAAYVAALKAEIARAGGVGVGAGAGPVGEPG
jgi:uncharacterized protein involved in exopolysaccharide biosynthesis